MVKSFKDYLIEDSGEVSFVFGRFNPPTIGHGKLMEALKKTARGGTYRIYPTQTQDSKNNPLDFKSKVKFMRKMFPKHARNIMADKGMRTAFDVVGALYEQGYKKVTMVVGEDRVVTFDQLLNKYNGKHGSKHTFYQFENGVKVISAGMRAPDSDDLETAMSASKLRHAASENDLDAFSKGMPAKFKDIQNLFNAVRKGLGLKEIHNYRKHVQLEKVSEKRENYIKGDLFKEGDEVVLKETDEVGTIKMCGSNYVLVEFGTTKKRCWLDSVEKLTEEGGAGEEGTYELTKKYMEDTPGQAELLDFKQFVLKDDFKLTPALKAELEKIAMKLDMKDFRDKGHKIAVAMNILKKKHGYS
jgi:nicotinamide mononucleotide adenylyltransferase